MLMTVGTMSMAEKSSEDFRGLMSPRQLRKAGSRIPPSQVVALPHRNGPAQPPRSCLAKLGLYYEKRTSEQFFSAILRFLPTHYQM